MGRYKFSPIIIMAWGIAAISELTYAQEAWVRTYGGSAWDWGECVLQTPDGGYIVTGGTRSWGAGESDVWLLKLDAYGDADWDRTYGGLEDDYGLCVHQTAGGYTILGSTRTGGQQDIWLLKIDTLGDTLWTKTYGSAMGYRGCWCEGTPDKGFVIVGEVIIDSTESDLLVMKIDSSGTWLWYKYYGVDGYDRAESVALTQDGGFMIVGATHIFGGAQHDLWLLRTDSLGDTLWTKTYGDPDYDWGRCIRATSDGGFIIAGENRVYPESQYDGWLLKVNSDGDTLWTRNYDGEEWDWINFVEQTSDGGFIMVGETKSFGDGEYDVWLVKTGSEGDTLWTQTYGALDWDWGKCVRQTSDGGYIIVGGTVPPGSEQADLFLIKTDENGHPAVAEDPVVTPRVNWKVLTPVGPQIILQYTDMPLGFHASVFDISGGEVDEIHASQQSGTIQWGTGYSPGVYFIRSVSGNLQTQKVILVK